MRKAGLLAVAGCAALGVLAPLGARAAETRVLVTVYDSAFRPYTAWGVARQGGAVVIFEPAPGAPARVETDAGPRAPARSAPLPSVEVAPARSAQPLVPTPGAPDEVPRSRAQAADRYVEGVYLVNPGYVLSYPKHVARILTSPSRFGRSDWINVALVTFATGALLLVDEPLIEFWQNDVRGDTSEALADAFRPLGESDNVVIGSLSAYALAEALDSTGVFDLRREKATALLVLQSFLLTQALITGTKYVTGRGRPEETDDAFDFQGPSMGDFNASFPSGHAGVAFSVASVLAETYGKDHPWVPWLAYALATGTALSRVDDKRHWVSDVFLGGTIGFFVGRMVTRYSPFMERNDITLAPLIKDDARGVALSLRF